MPGISLTAVQRLPDPAPLFRFECEFPVINLPRGNQAELLSTASIQKISVGTQIIATEDVEFSGWQKHFPSGSSTEDITVTFLEDGNYSVTDYFVAWRSLIQDEFGDFGLPGGNEGYWKNLVLYGLDTTGKRTSKFRMTDCFPVSVQNYDYDGEASTMVFVNVSFKCFQSKFERGGFSRTFNR